MHINDSSRAFLTRCRPLPMIKWHRIGKAYGIFIGSLLFTLLHAGPLSLRTEMLRTKHVHRADALLPMGFTKRSVNPAAVENWDGVAVDSDFLMEHDVEVLNFTTFPGRLTHIHHACVGMGTRDIAVPHLGALMRAYGPLNGDFQQRTGLVGRGAGIREMTFDELQQVTGVQAGTAVRLLRGNTLLLDCWDRDSHDDNPAHLLMRLCPLYELGEEVMDMRKAGIEVVVPRYSHIAWHRCASSKSVLQGDWPFGKLLWDASFAHWEQIGFGDPDSMSMIDINELHNEWVCFEDLYTDHQYYLYAGPHFSSWQNILLELLTTNNLSRPEGHAGIEDVEPVWKRIEEGRARIHIAVRTSGASLRTFVNMEEVIELVGRYTTEPVRLLKTDIGVSIHEAARLYQGFDVLITPHGSQSINLVFTNASKTAVIEVIGAHHDETFMKTGEYRGQAVYIFSTGHEPVPGNSNECNKAWFLEHCPYQDQTQEHRCRTWPDGDIIKNCHMIINLHVLGGHISDALEGLKVATKPSL